MASELISPPASRTNTRGEARATTAAWILAAFYYFYQYALRSAPSVMVPQLSEAFGISALKVASMVGLFYYGCWPFSLVAGAAIDRFGPKRVLPIAATAVGIGALLFSLGGREAAYVGRLLQGAGGAFALVGAIYIATKNFPASRAATLIGATQMFGMAGGAAGQFAVGHLLAAGLSWKSFWVGTGVLGLATGVVLLILLPREKNAARQEQWMKSTMGAFGIIFRNPQSILCGIIAGFLFIPTTIFDMIWGVRYLQEAHSLDYPSAVMRSASVPLGWIFGCPLLGFISDRIGRRKPVIIGGALVLLMALAWILFGRTDVFPAYSVGLVAGLASGAAMLPYVVIKEVNSPQFGGSATGVINFLNLTFSALLGPVFGGLLQYVSRDVSHRELAHYQVAFLPLLFGVVIAIILSFLLKESGPLARKVPPDLVCRFKRSAQHHPIH